MTAEPRRKADQSFQPANAAAEEIVRVDVFYKTNTTAA